MNNSKSLPFGLSSAAAVLVSIWALVVSPQILHAQVVVNGDFETGAAGFVTWPGYVGGGANPVEIPGWTGTGGRGINPVVPGGPTDYPFRDNGGNLTTIAFLQGASTLQQDIGGFILGTTYVLSLDFNARNCCGDLPIASILLDGLILASSAALFPAPGGVIPVGADNPWYHVDVPFQATDSTITLLFSAAPAAGGDATLLLDNISIAAVPEPATGLLAVLGLALFAAWRIKATRRSY